MENRRVFWLASFCLLLSAVPSRPQRFFESNIETNENADVISDPEWSNENASDSKMGKIGRTREEKFAAREIDGNKPGCSRYCVRRRIDGEIDPARRINIIWKILDDPRVAFTTEPSTIWADSPNSKSDFLWDPTTSNSPNIFGYEDQKCELHLEIGCESLSHSTTANSFPGETSDLHEKTLAWTNSARGYTETEFTVDEATEELRISISGKLSQVTLEIPAAGQAGDKTDDVRTPRAALSLSRTSDGRGTRLDARNPPSGGWRLRLLGVANSNYSLGVVAASAKPAAGDSRVSSGFATAATRPEDSARHGGKSPKSSRPLYLKISGGDAGTIKSHDQQTIDGRFKAGEPEVLEFSASSDSFAKPEVLELSASNESSGKPEVLELSASSDSFAKPEVLKLSASSDSSGKSEVLELSASSDSFAKPEVLELPAFSDSFAKPEVLELSASSDSFAKPEVLELSASSDFFAKPEVLELPASSDSFAKPEVLELPASSDSFAKPEVLDLSASSDSSGKSEARESTGRKFLRKSPRAANLEVEMMKPQSSDKIVSGGPSNQTAKITEDTELEELSRSVEEVQTRTRKTVVELSPNAQLIAKPPFHDVVFAVTNNQPLGIRHVFQGRSTVFPFVGILPANALWIRSGETVEVAVRIRVTETQDSSPGVVTLYVGGNENFEVAEKSTYVYVQGPNGLTTTDTDKPSIDYVFNDNCNGKLNRDRCNKSLWSVEVTAKDSDSGLKSVTSLPKGLEPRTAFIAGTKNAVTFYYVSTCCYTTVDIKATDVQGNIYTRTVDVTAWDNLSQGEIAAIVVGALLILLLIVLIILLAVYCVRRRKSHDLSYSQRYGSRTPASTERTNF